MLMKSQYEKFYPGFSIHVPLILEGGMVMFSLNYPTQRSRTENNLKVFIAELSDFDRKLSSLEKLYCPQEFSSGTWRHFQIAINSNH